ncbi:MAG: flippase-like domain-containing protein [Deltaproteobacteria bacterium]|nr:flippase-like domain-containing protein [Deltaproteobacteria bacterium]
MQNALVWGVTALCIWWVARGVSFEKFFKSLKQVNIAVFVGLNVASFLFWWLGETYLFVLLFNFFHERKTNYRELLPATAAQYFLQAINILAADGALVVFLNRRKGVKWLTATWTMMFQGLVDGLVLSSLTVAAGLLVPSSPIRRALPYASGVMVFFLAVAGWWALGRPKTSIGKWLYNRPSAKAFREAGVRAYLTLGSIRLGLLTLQVFVYHYSIAAFARNVPMVQTLALSPGIQAASDEPITPQGLGPLQAVVVGGLAKYAPRDKILAAALGISVVALLCRLPLGLGAAGTFARRVLAIEASEKKESEQESSTTARREPGTAVQNET